MTNNKELIMRNYHFMSIGIQGPAVFLRIFTFAFLRSIWVIDFSRAIFVFLCNYGCTQRIIGL